MADQSTSTGTVGTKYDDLIGGYREILDVVNDLPFFSIWPLLIYLLNFFILFFGIFIELILFLPYTLPILILRIFKIRPPLFLPFTKRLKYALTYLHRGEFQIGAIVLRPVIRWLVRRHVTVKLDAIYELTYLNKNISPDERQSVLTKLDAEKKFWNANGMLALLRTNAFLVFPIGFFGYLIGFAHDAQTEDAMRLIGGLILLYVVFILLSYVLDSFPVKRGIFLGRARRQASFPGGVSGNGIYGVEREIFELLGEKNKSYKKEFAADIIGTSFLNIISYGSIIIFYISLLSGSNEISTQNSYVVQIATNGITIILVTIAAAYAGMRRVKLKRD